MYILIISKIRLQKVDWNRFTPQLICLNAMFKLLKTGSGMREGGGGDTLCGCVPLPEVSQCSK